MTVHLVCSDQGGRRLRYHVTQPRHGFLKLNSAGEGVWQADPSFVGTDEFTYWAVAQTDAGPVKSSLGTFRFSFVRRVPPLKAAAVHPQPGSRERAREARRRLAEPDTGAQVHTPCARRRSPRPRQARGPSRPRRLAQQRQLQPRHVQGRAWTGGGPDRVPPLPIQHDRAGRPAVRRKPSPVARRGGQPRPLHRQDRAASAPPRSRGPVSRSGTSASVSRSWRSGPGQVIAPGGDVLHKNESYQKPPRVAPGPAASQAQL